MELMVAIVAMVAKAAIKRLRLRKVTGCKVQVTRLCEIGVMGRRLRMKLRNKKSSLSHDRRWVLWSVD